jgi:putative membrane-bound dehydrogenase-like protein
MLAQTVVSPEELPRIPPTPPDRAAATCAVRPGFQLELVAAEPLVVDPVAMAFDEDGRLYVVEMRDYSERRAEKLGRVKLLEDTDGDGRYDQASIFADNLPWPTAVTCWDGGIFVVAAPDLLYFKDTDGDRRADVHAMIFTGFGNLAEKLNVQALPNSLQWGPDQRIHGALGGNPSRVTNFARHGTPPVELRGRDFSFDPRTMDLRPESGGGQWGITFDDAGRKFACANSRHLMQVLYDDRFAAAAKTPLPAPAVDIAADGPQAEVFRLSPDEPWRVLRTKWRVEGTVKGLVEGGGRPSGYFTSATGVTIYRGDAYGPEFRGNAFIADCGSNLIHRKILHGDGQLVAQRAPGEEKSEFLASRDNWFRPVSLTNAPDGCLWFCDMYREVIEHPWSLPEPLKARLDLNAGHDRGRIWRIVPAGHTPRAAPRLGASSTAELIALLEHPNGWHRDTAARLLHERNDPAATPALAAVVARRTPENIVPKLKVSRDAGYVPPAPAGPRADAWRQFRPALDLRGEALKGRAVFATRCAVCHRFAGQGQAVGPDLDASAAAGREKLLGNILEPSREITASFALGIATLKNGEVVAGILASESPAGLVLRLPGGGEKALAQADLTKIERPTQSLMPDGLEAGLSVQDMADLLTFLGAE